MFTLIKREIEDNYIYFIIAIIFTSIVTAVLVADWHYRDHREPPAMSIALFFVGTVGYTILFCAMGAAQMYTDRNKKISAFISTLAVTRRQILTARIITGLLAITIFLLPVLITCSTLLHMHSDKQPFIYINEILWSSFVSVFLLFFSFYCIGLQTGWKTNKAAPTLGGIGLSLVLAPLIFIKGIGIEIVIILTVFIAASLTRVWLKFKSASL